MYSMSSFVISPTESCLECSRGRPGAIMGPWALQGLALMGPPGSSWARP